MKKATNVNRVDVFAGRIAGLDTLRALAVVLVVTYHVFPIALPGGFLGVDVFFVVSGFLITGLLLRQWRQEGRIDLIGFWQRRLRRLVPALVAVVLVTGALAATIGGDILVGIERQIIGALTSTSNWVSIAAGSSYTSDFYPEPLTHLWSLAVEEQFYVLWPVVSVAVLVFGKRVMTRARVKLTPLRALGVVSLALALTSAVLMAVVAGSGDDFTRAYYGTHTHLVGVMLGAALATAVSSVSGGVVIARIRRSRRAQRLVCVIAAMCLAALGALAALLEWNTLSPYRGGIGVASVATAGIIFALLCFPEHSRRAERGALAWIGQRSYGLYLYHWPFYVVGFYAFNDLPGVLRGFLVIALTVLCAAVSYTYIEQPIRRLGFRAVGRAALRSIRATSPSGVRVRRTLFVLVSGSLACLAATGYGVAHAPKTTQLEQQLAVEQQLLTSSDDLGLVADSPDPQPVDEHSAARTEPDHDAGHSTPHKPIRPEVSGKNTTVIGDSVTLAAASKFKEELPGVVISASVGRNLSEAPQIIENIEKHGKLRKFVVISLATNSTATEDQLRDIVQCVGKDRAIVLVNGHAERSWIKKTNKLISRAPQLFDNVVVANWDEQAKKNPKIFGPDGIHPRPDRAGVYVDVIVDAMRQAQKEVF